MANDYHNAHKVKRQDPRVDGPYLDDIRADQERAYREFRNAEPVAPPVAEVHEEVEVTILGDRPLFESDKE